MTKFGGTTGNGFGQSDARQSRRHPPRRTHSDAFAVRVVWIRAPNQPQTAGTRVGRSPQAHLRSTPRMYPGVFLG